MGRAIMTDALLMLADGTSFRGRAVGATGEAFGEVVFNTSLTGYQEVLTDPSYHGQVVTMTYPHQGNYGTNDIDAEASRPWVRGFVMREACPRPSSWRSQESLAAYLARHDVVGIEGIDTRRLVRHIRSSGAMKGGVSTTDTDEASLLDRVRAAPELEETDLVAEVTPSVPYDADPEMLAAGGGWGAVTTPADERVEGARVAVLDLGMKRNILRCLVATGFSVRVFGAGATAEEILAWDPDGAFVSNGPGDPAAIPAVTATLRDLLAAKVPTFGICLGHQVLGTALGGRTYKLPFGHRGANHPVKSFDSGRVEITTQNHGFAVRCGRDPAEGGDAWQALAGSTAEDWRWGSELGEVALTHWDLNDGTLEGLRCLEVPAYSVQYHPEAAPGPHDSRYLFGSFADLITEGGRHAHR